MKQIKTFLIFGLLLIIFGSANPQPLQSQHTFVRATIHEDKEIQQVRQAVQAKLMELKAAADFPGATFGFVLPEGRSGSVSVGVSNVEKKTTLVSTDRMLAGSIGKTYLAAVVLKLVEEGKLNLDEKIERWFGSEKWFARLPNAKDITLRMLMNHTSGIPEHVLDPRFIAAMKTDPDKVWTPEEMISFIFDAKPLFPAGKGFSYADTNYIVVGMIFEKVTKRKVYGEVERRVLKPLKLANTIPSDRRSLPGVITGYSRAGSPFGIEGPMIVDGKFVFNPQMEWTGGGFASTAEDLARWAKFLYEAKVFGRAQLEQMLHTDEVRQGRGGGGGYGLGVQIWKTDFGTSYGHGGWFPGYLSQMEYFPDQKIAVAIQFNSDDVRKLKIPPRAYLLALTRVVFDQVAVKKAA